MRIFFKIGLRILYFFFLFSVFVVSFFKWFAPPTTAFMIQKKFQLIMNGAKETAIRHKWVAYGDISPSMPLAVVAAEDQRFLNHRGFDLTEIRKAMEGIRKGKRVRGASTITQQVAKNLFLWPGRSFFRKGIEAYFTLLIELMWSKKRILEVYLNIAEMGERIFGVKAASEIYFKKPPSQLTRKEAALLAAILPDPLNYSARKPSAYVKSRRNHILRQMNLLDGTRYLENLPYHAEERTQWTMQSFVSRISL